MGEYLNRHTGEAGLLGIDFTYETDASVDLAREKLAFLARDGISREELIEFIRSAQDQGGITNREARQISEALRHYYNQLPEDCRKIADVFEQKFSPLVNDLHDASAQGLSELTFDWLGFEKARDVQPGQELDTVALGGADLGAFFDELDGVA